MTDRVCISIATKGTLRAETVEWLLGAFVQLAPQVEVHIVSDPRPLEHARNTQVHRLLASRCTHLFLLDSDCIPQNGTIQGLLAHHLPVVAAPHPTQKGQETGLMVLDKAGEAYVQHRPWVGLQEVDAVGTAGVLVERSVFLSFGPPWFHCVYNDQGLLTKSEDFWFCDRVREQGYAVWADCGLAQNHVVTVRL